MRKIETKEVVVIDKVYDECRNVAKGIVIEKLPFLDDIKYITSTIECLPSSTFFKHTENNFARGAMKNALPQTQWENARDTFLESADAKLLLFCLTNQDLLIRPRIVTEETETENDKKLFKKIPSLCKILDIDPISLPKLLQECDNIDCGFFDKKQ